VQKLADQRAPHLVAHVAQARTELAPALAGPQQRRLRIAARLRLDQQAKIVEQARIGLTQRLTTTARPAHAVTSRDLSRAQFGQAAPNCAARDPRDARYRAHPPRPAATASAAANRRRPCSSSTGASASNRSRIADTSITRIGYRIASPVGIPPRSKNHHPSIHLFADGSFSTTSTGKSVFCRIAMAFVGSDRFNDTIAAVAEELHDGHRPRCRHQGRARSYCWQACCCGRACSCQMLRSRQLIGRGGKVKRVRLSLVPGAAIETAGGVGGLGAA
jgi:hypothetical protein